MKKIFRAFNAVLAALSLFTFAGIAYASDTAPDEMTICPGYPVKGPYTLSFDDTAAADSTSENINIDAQLRLFGIVPVKTVDVQFSDRQVVNLGGTPFGIRLYTDGLVVSKTAAVPTENGSISPAQEAGIRCGDIILEANGEKLRTNEQLSQICEKSGGSPILLRCSREGKGFSASIIPVKDCQLGGYHIGLWVRDSCAGIGTITFTDRSTNSFAGLGHGIYDGDSGSLMPLCEGDIVPADIISVDKSAGGSPGSLCGCFTSGEPIGILSANSECGLYGSLNTSIEGEQAEIAFRQEVTKGKAKLLSTISGNEPEYYDIEIEDISYNSSDPSKSIVIRITDKRLIDTAGGIVRGMSGSPIIQNGRLAGAVTHVFIDDPIHGYAAFAETMADYSRKSSQGNTQNTE